MSVVSTNRERSSWTLWLQREDENGEPLYYRIATGRPYRGSIAEMPKRHDEKRNAYAVAKSTERSRVPDSADAIEIEITPEMVLAGEVALASVVGEDYLLPESLIVDRVYRAMRALEPPRPTGVPERVSRVSRS